MPANDASITWTVVRVKYHGVPARSEFSARTAPYSKVRDRCSRRFLTSLRSFPWPICIRNVSRPPACQLTEFFCAASSELPAPRIVTTRTRQILCRDWTHGFCEMFLPRVDSRSATRDSSWRSPIVIVQQGPAAKACSFSYADRPMFTHWGAAPKGLVRSNQVRVADRHPRMLVDVPLPTCSGPIHQKGKKKKKKINSLPAAHGFRRREDLAYTRLRDEPAP